MRYVSLCSGIEATTIAWSNQGWECLATAEIDPFACAVLAYRLPEVPNLGDVKNIDWREIHERFGIIDVLFASTPCQSFSVAGNRLGLEGESGLMLEFVRAIKELVAASNGTSPRYIVWENVPGCLSSGPRGKKGEDFRCLLRELDECGYGLAWRRFNSEFARVHDWKSGRFGRPAPQRRRRVYLVGSLGCNGAEEILIERSCLRGDHPKGRETRAWLAEDADGCVEIGDSGILTMSSVRTRAAIDDGISGTLDAGHEQPIIVMDRAAFNQGKNAKYPPHVEETDIMDTLVAREPHAVCYPDDGRYVVRRVTPLESERLQALPDGWTDLTGCDVEAITDAVHSVIGGERNKIRRKVRKWSISCPDAPRYRATGNSITTTVLEIIAQRIEAFDVLHYDEIGF